MIGAIAGDIIEFLAVALGYLVCQKEQEPHFYPYQILLRYKTDGQDQIQCQKSYEMVNPIGLIDDMAVVNN